MLTARRLIDFLGQSPLVSGYALFWVFPIFGLQLCLYLNVNDRPAGPLFFLQTALIVFFIPATALHIPLLISGRFSKPARARLLGIFDVLFVTLFVLAVFFPVRYALLDGREYPPVPFLETIKQLAIPAIAAAALFFLSQKKPYEFKVLKTTILAACIIFIGYTATAMNNEYKNKLRFADNTEEAVCGLGRRNVILLIVETFQGDYLEELAVGSPEIFASFSGMTLFPRAVTSTGWSPFSTVQIFSGGHDWSKYETRAEAIDSLNGDSLLTTAQESGYRFSGGKYTPAPGGEYASTPNEEIPLRVRLPYIVLTHSPYYFASMRRMMPAVAWNRLRWLENKIYGRYLLAGQYPGKIAARNNFIGLTNCLRIGEANTFLYFFNYMTHVEILFDRDGNAIPGLPRNKETQLGEYTYTLSLHGAFLDRLKRLGVYDEALIVIMGDHGAYNEPGRNYNPAILIKPPRAEGKLAVSRANILHTDIRPLIEAYMRGGDEACRAEFLRLTRETGARKLRVYTYSGGDPDSGKNYQPLDIFGDVETVVRSVNKD